MKVVAMLGGLGSQMFKYAFYLQICEEVQCYIDTTSFLLNEMWNGYELGRIFGISAPDIKDYWTAEDIVHFKKADINYKETGVQAMRKLERNKKVVSFLRGYCYADPSDMFLNLSCLIFNKIKRLIRHNKMVEDVYPFFYKTGRVSFYYDEFNHISDAYIGNGRMRERLREIYRFSEFDDDKNALVGVKMREMESVAVHVRRSDHMYDNVRLFETGYFRRAVLDIKDRVATPSFYIFSDEPEWCKTHGEQLGFEATDQVVVVDWNVGNDSYKDMQLMTYCKHNILSISSFGWWGYYLSPRENKLVYAPEGYWLEVPIHY